MVLDAAKQLNGLTLVQLCPWLCRVNSEPRLRCTSVKGEFEPRLTWPKSWNTPLAWTCTTPLGPLPEPLIVSIGFPCGWAVAAMAGPAARPASVPTATPGTAIAMASFFQVFLLIPIDPFPPQLPHMS